jgi:DNA-binding response OmpR family regulator
MSKYPAILIITDNPVINRLILNNLHDYECLVINSDTPNLINFILNKKLDLIILGRTLKGAEGIELCSSISNRNTDNNLKILLIATNKKVGQKAIDNGANAFMHIPFKDEELKRLVKELITKNYTVLLVEDSKSITKIISKSLIENNYEVHTATNGIEGISLLKKLAYNIDLIISDVEMPHMDGYELCKTLKNDELSKNIPIILLTSLNSNIAISKGFEVGANDYLTKPVVLIELLDRISNQLKPEKIVRDEVVMIIKNNKSKNNLLIDPLRKQGFRIKTEENEEEICGILNNNTLSAILIDYDVMKNRADKYCRIIRNSNKPNTPIIITTSYDINDNSLISIRSVGIQAVIKKPYIPEQLVSELERVIAQYKHKMQIKKVKSYLSDYAIESLEQKDKLEDNIPARAIDQHRTILFCDLVGFTSLTESLGAREIVDLLNIYFDSMIEIIIRKEGNIDKLIGDCIMAIFPEREKGASLAVDAALNMLDSIFHLNKQSSSNYHVRIGINSGHVLIGDIGSKLYKDFTCIGDTVNLASRLESIAGSDEIFISEYTKELLNSANFKIQSKGEVTVKGKKLPVKTYKILNSKLL